MRSNAAPPLSQAIAPTMTGTWNFTPSANVVPVTVNAGSALTTGNIQTWNPLEGLDTIITNDGNVGIGDESPGAMLSIRGMAESGPSTFIEFTGANQVLNITNGSSDNWLYTSNTSFTVELLIKFDTAFPGTGIILGGHGGTTGSVEQWSWRFGQTNGKLVAYHIDSQSAVAD